MANFKETTDESKRRWDANAEYWDTIMGDKSNFFHNNIVCPDTENLLDINQGDLVLDIACGNGNFSQRIAEKGAKVVAFDYSEKLIEQAKKRREKFLSKIDFRVCDATNYSQIMNLKQERLFDKAVSNMAIMDISEIEDLLKAVYNMLKQNGIFVFSTHHPCFIKPKDIYTTPIVHEGVAINGQPVLQLYYHRSLEILFNMCFSTGFIINGFYEKVDKDEESPVIMIVRLLKL